MTINLALAQAAALLVLDARPDACAPRDGEDLLVCAADDRLTDVVPMTLNGTKGRLMIAPGGEDAITCNHRFAARAGFGDAWYRPLATVGPVIVTGWSAHAWVRAAGKSWMQQVEWTRSDFLDRADCVTGPRRLPFPRVRFRYGEPRADAVATTLRFHDYGGNLYVAVPVGRETLAVRFEPRFARSVLTAPAAQAIAPVHGGTATGRFLAEPISYGVKRPVRRFALLRPLSIGTMTLAHPFVRGDDSGAAMNIRSVDPDKAEEGDMIVAAKRPKPGRRKLVRVGGDDLMRCVEVTVDKKRKEMTLVC